MKFFFGVALILWQASFLFAQDYSFEIPEDEKEDKLEWSGNFDGKYSINKMQPSSQLYQLQFFGQNDLPEYLSQYRFELYLNSDYQTKDIGFHLKTHTSYYSESQTSIDLFEAYGNLNLSMNTFIQAGKKMYSWGKGYAFNPVGYINPFKDPENPELAQAGILSFNFETIKSFQSDILKTMAFTFVAIPPDDIINNRYTKIENTALAAKLYFLLYDTDVDIMGYYNKAGSKKIGFTVSHNVFENLEVHKELSYFSSLDKYTFENNNIIKRQVEGITGLVGIRYLNEWNTTVIVEYYHNDAGLTKSEYSNYVSMINNSVNTGNEEIIKRMLGYNQSHFSTSSLMQNYLYVKIIQPEPFDWLYFTPSLFTIYNLQDNSFILALPLSYKPVTNFEFIFWPTFLFGNNETEYGSKQAQSRLDLWMRFYF